MGKCNEKNVTHSKMPDKSMNAMNYIDSNLKSNLVFNAKGTTGKNKLYICIYFVYADKYHDMPFF